MPRAEAHSRNKRFVQRRLQALCRASVDDLEDSVGAVYADDARLFAFHPVNECTGAAAIASALWRPLRSALPDLQRRVSILIAGESGGRDLVAVMGHLQGTFTRPLFDIPPTHGVVHIRYGEVHRVVNGRISETWMIADLLDLMRQAGCYPIAPALGAEGRWPGPATQDGVLPDKVGPDRGAESLRLVRRMHAGLLRFDGKRLESMDHEQYWTPDFLWYGPSGIGTTRGLHGFRAHHQVPFLRAFPDRRVEHHFGQVGDGNYAVTGGWPSVVATHLGPGFLAMPATGRSVGMRVMDFYRVEDGLIAENWVPIDMIDLLGQMGVDVFERVRHLQGRPRMSLD